MAKPSPFVSSPELLLYKYQFDILKMYPEITFHESSSEERNDRLKCVMCLRYPIFNSTGKCGHVYCRLCFGLFDDRERFPDKCIRCQEVYDNSPVVENLEIKREILKLYVRCPNMKLLCPWVDRLYSLPSHLLECDKKCRAAPQEDDEMDEVDEEMPENSRLPNYLGPTSYEFTLKNIQDAMTSTGTATCASKIVCCFPDAMTMRPEFDVKFGSVYVILKPLQPDDESTSSSDGDAKGDVMVYKYILPRLKYIVYGPRYLDESVHPSRLIEKNCIRIIEQQFGHEITHELPAYTTYLGQSVFNQIVCDDEIRLKIEVDFPQAKLPNGVIRSGVFNWDINDFSAKHDMLKDQFVECISGEFFYTKAVGYRVRAAVYRRGVTFIKIDVLNGPYDERLHKRPTFLMRAGVKDSDGAYFQFFTRMTRDFSESAALPADYARYLHNDTLSVQITCMTINDNLTFLKEWEESDASMLKLLTNSTARQG